MSAEEHMPEEMKVTPNPYEQKQEARRARLEAAADRTAEKADQYFSGARGSIAGIPPGQPILVGHHSEARHRRDLKRHDSQMRKGIEAQKQAKELEHRAAAVGKGGISSDDPEAIEKLTRKLESLIAQRDRMKKLNALFRKQGTLHETDFLDDEERKEVLMCMRYSTRKGAPYKSYMLQNLGANIRTVQGRIRQLQTHAEMPEVEPEQIGEATVSVDKDENRVLLTFPARLSKEDYRLVRSYGFVWSRTRKAFVRKFNNSALYSGQVVARQIAEKKGSV